MPSTDRNSMVLAVVAVVALASLAYSVLVAQTVLLWLVIAVQLFVVYLFWRLVVAVERIADAQDRR
jgi:hypothetical protein